MKDDDLANLSILSEDVLVIFSGDADRGIGSEGAGDVEDLKELNGCDP